MCRASRGGTVTRRSTGQQLFFGVVSGSRDFVRSRRRPSLRRSQSLPPYVPPPPVPLSLPQPSLRLSVRASVLPSPFLIQVLFPSSESLPPPPPNPLHFPSISRTSSHSLNQTSMNSIRAREPTYFRAARRLYNNGPALPANSSLRVRICSAATTAPECAMSAAD